ncbi:ThiF family adenylyltransferase [Klebsiella pneumoniae]|uniref:ThiF family adenylyltransferase n=1 Tax=Klebsiella/Raoultella group TaxID=2890311 RepID=UPI000E2E1756|nr:MULTISPECIES: ThiF family adenylyltransferase [Klebsiella]ELB7364990.1 ThiF family adenylyltransferase [Klebsiella pneumoniae]EMA2381457.1 ThiF family adenylyltransferase [Klebsiella pneumoniae]MBD7030171.1 ThiF family adenylyltransferase [Klebsiella pneumoniae]MCW9238082.1 ThiF family adenylyltransferase [Klebsiella variicola]MCW9275932.1 ThiF family adenylyltransferase [Klebsiella variicola]
MSAAPFSLNNDLKRLREEGYYVQIVGGFLVMHEVPYVNAQLEVKTGTLISSLCMSGNITQKPEPHTIHFDGDYPCTSLGVPIQAIAHQSVTVDLGHDLRAQHMFSSKPGPEGYSDYHQKMTTYATIISGHAAILKPGATPRVFKNPDEEEGCVFNYLETASDRAGIGALTARLEGQRILILGVGGTGSYVLDQVAKTPVSEIRLIDGDDFLQHNAFRAPGAPSIDLLREVPKKVDYLTGIYSNMHRHIVPHAVQLDIEHLHLLDGVDFAFLCMDAGESKRLAVQKLEDMGVPFVDVGMGLELNDGSLGGILRVTTSTPNKRDHIRQRVSFKGGGAENLYASNIQVAELNMMNAALAVIKWKKLLGFYRDLENEHHCSYTTDGNMLLNGDTL